MYLMRRYKNNTLHRYCCARFHLIQKNSKYGFYGFTRVFDQEKSRPRGFQTIKPGGSLIHKYCSKTFKGSKGLEIYQTVNSAQNVSLRFGIQSRCLSHFQNPSNQGRLEEYRPDFSSNWHPSNIKTETQNNSIRRFSTSARSDTRRNHANIQMLSEVLYKQVFRDVEPRNLDKRTCKKIEKHLSTHGLWDKQSTELKDVDFPLPELLGNNIEEHFELISKKQNATYFGLAEHMANSLTQLPSQLNEWLFQAGWTKYNKDGTTERIDVPDESVLVFDVEVCMSEGNIPVLATAVSKNAWYCWISDHLYDENSGRKPDTITPDWMIPIEKDGSEEKLLIGHHIGFDRTYIKEQYQLKNTKTRFLDTLSLHVCVSGVTNEQRYYLMSKNPITYDWMEVGSTNSLENVFKFYCRKKLDKATRDLFIEGSLQDIRRNFQECVDYCASDVAATQEVFQTVWPMFLHHVPHPVSFCGMLEMGTAYLPINQNWKKYVQQAEETYVKVTDELKESLMSVAEETLVQVVGEEYRQNPWTWSMDWNLHKTVLKEVEKINTKLKKGSDIHQHILDAVKLMTEKRLSQLNFPGYPKWYRDLCPRDADPARPRPSNISSQTKVTPSILQMTWDGYPLLHVKDLGWGYLAPVNSHVDTMQRDFKSLVEDTGFPYEAYLEVIEKRKEEIEKRTSADLMEAMYKEDVNETKGIDIGIPFIRFHKLPHKDGDQFNVGNPLAKDFLSKIEDGILATRGDFNAKQPIELNKMLSFWRNGRKRVRDQLAVWLKNEDVSENEELGVILPRVITAGTVTRRGVEPTWLTASNPSSTRIGSELKSMVQAPPGHYLVGADVDSQELWIASILGDAEFEQIHGCTALSWMTLQGKKSERTDLHSKTADTIGMTRDQAKVFNYGRVYGGGQAFAVRLLMQFNPTLTKEEAEFKARALYESTKGVKSFRLNSKGIEEAHKLRMHLRDGELASYSQLRRLLDVDTLARGNLTEIAHPEKVWHNGSESHMFNKLESIALSDEPRTPVLNCLITNALLPKYVHNFYKTSRVNWVVQSSAVDYLHLMLTCMKWLIEKYNIDARFCVSIHDEVRYIVSEKDRYRLALALQITNLLTRSLFSYKLGLNDLPQSVAFFSSVDIDQVLRKEVDLDCVTPSNPQGLKEGYGIDEGESMDIYALLDKTNGGSLSYDNSS